LFVSTDVTFWAGPFHDAVRPVRSSARAPPWTGFVLDATVPAPKTDQPVVPPSMSGFVNRFPLAARAGATWADTAASDTSDRVTARANERAVFLLTLLFLSGRGRSGDRALRGLPDRSA
jgi:hypothetical protein